jgi:2-succinyl-6-hydroxy-2,4-cyclohexadiene-1-carboxylate synthase
MSDIAASSIDWHIEWHGDPQLPVLALIHGFSGSLHSWEYLLFDLEKKFHLLLVDLPGHGRTPLPNEPDFNLVQLGEALGQLISSAAEGPAFVCGYSMGGRIALHTALYAPEMVKGLALIGSWPGIADAKEREERRKSDFELAKNIREKGMEWFADYWGNLPLFASQKSLAEPVKEKLRESRLANDPERLAWCLEHFSVGVQEDLHPKLFELQRPLLLVAGSLDKKFCRTNMSFENFVKGYITVKRVEIHGVGHAAHIEAPDVVAQELIEFFTPYLPQ